MCILGWALGRTRLTTKAWTKIRQGLKHGRMLSRLSCGRHANWRRGEIGQRTRPFVLHGAYLTLGFSAGHQVYVWPSSSAAIFKFWIVDPTTTVVGKKQSTQRLVHSSAASKRLSQYLARWASPFSSMPTVHKGTQEVFLKNMGFQSLLSSTH